MGQSTKVHGIDKQGRVAQRITRPPTERKIAGSSPAVVEIFFLILNRVFGGTEWMSQRRSLSIKGLEKTACDAGATQFNNCQLLTQLRHIQQVKSVIDMPHSGMHHLHNTLYI